jgi:hypothetical protein
MLASMTAVQFREWCAFAELEPFGPERIEMAIADVNKTLMNIHRRKNSKPLDLYDVQLMFGDARRPARKKNWREMLNVAQIMTAESRKGRSQ